MSAMVAPSTPITPHAAIIMVMTANATRMIRSIENADSASRFSFLPFFFPIPTTCLFACLPCLPPRGSSVPWLVLVRAYARDAVVGAIAHRPNGAFGATPK